MHTPTNPPGRRALQYRVGEHGSFLAAMLHRLSSPEHPELRRLTVRSTDDPAIALLDAAAVVGDLLTFHSERIADEAYLRTADDRRSLGLLGRLVDYRPRPGLAADTHLAYRLDPRAQPGGEVLIPRGARSSSVPAVTGEQPQTFETDADLTARAEWNRLAVRRHRPGLLVPGDLAGRAEILVSGTNTRLAPGDRLLFVFGTGDTAIRRLLPVTRVRVDREQDVTAIGLAPSSPVAGPLAFPANALTELAVLRVTTAPFGVRAALQPVRDEQGRVISQTDWPLPGVTLTTTRVVLDPAGGPAVRAEFVHAQADGAVQHSENLPTEPKTVSFGPGRLTLTGTAEAVTVELRPGLPAHRLAVSTPGPDRRLTVTVDDRDPVPLAPGEQQQLTVDGQEVSVRYLATPPAAVEIGIAVVPDPGRRTVLPLDAVHPTITAGSLVAVERPGKGDQALVITRVVEARTVTHAAFGSTGRGTLLTLADPWLDEHDVLLSQIRDTTVYGAGEALRPAGQPIDEDVHGDRIELAERYDGLLPGRVLAVTGERTEIVVVAGVEHGTDPDLPADHPHTTLTLARALRHRYRRDRVELLGNVVPASNGESRDEPIGSGDATATHQTFTLWQEPLTWLPAAGPPGARPALEIRVDGLLWQLVDSLAGRGPGEKVYVLGAAPDGRTTVSFGDGRHGARLPTGPENVRARYRFGAGAAGNLPPGRITQAVTRPLGVLGVSNPVPATGGADPDGPGLARRRIPLAVATLDRLLSTRDYAQFARSRVGIARATAAEVFDGRRRVVHVTVAGVDDVPLDPDADLLPALRAALAAAGDPRLPVRVDVRDLVALRLAAAVKVAPDHSWELVEPRLRQALLRRLGYAGRELARAAHLSEVMAVADRVPGVDYLDVSVFSTTDGPAEARPVVPARPARYVETGRFRGIRPAQFTVLAPDDLTLTEIP